MYNFGGYLSSDFHDAYLEFAQQAYGIQKSSPLWRRCVRGTDSSLDMGVSMLFIKGSGFTNESIHHVCIIDHPRAFLQMGTGEEFLNTHYSEIEVHHKKDHIKITRQSTKSEVLS